jgi:hypothetical protein
MNHYTLRWYDKEQLVYITNVMAPSSIVALEQAQFALKAHTAEAFEKGHNPDRVTAQLSQS